MKIVIAGGTGHLGTILARAFHDDDIVLLSRERRVLPWRVVQWDGKTLGSWSEEIDGTDVIINLAGRSVDCRYTAVHRQEILESRVDSARAIAGAIGAAAHPPRVWLQASTATIYAHRFDAANDEHSGMIGGAEADAPAKWHFSIDVATAWERVVDEADLPATRKVKLRTAIVMSRHRGGAFSIFRLLARLRLGGTMGDGRQYVSWIHERDFVRAVRWLMEREELSGGVNVAAPHPLPNRDFMGVLRDVCGVRAGLPAKKWMLELAALVHRTETELLLKSRRVVPARLLDSGFTFEFPSWPEAARELGDAGSPRW